MADGDAEAGGVRVMSVASGIDGMTDFKQKICLGCCGGVGLVVTIIVAVTISGIKHLGPDDQVVIKSASGKSVVNGPQAAQTNPFKSKEWRKAQLLDPLKYAVVQDTLSAVVRHEQGPQLLFLGAYDELREVRDKLVLEKDQYVRLVDLKTGIERVERGPTTIVPSPTETSANGTQRAVFLDTETAAVVLHRQTGLRRLVTACTESTGVFTPAPNEEIVELRSLIHVLPHEAMIVRDVQGTMTVYSGAEQMTSGPGVCRLSNSTSGDGQGTSFFLEPYSRIVRMFWSDYSQTPGEVTTTTTTAPGSNATVGAGVATGSTSSSSIAGGSADSIYATQPQTSTRSGPKVAVVKIDLRARKAFYDYEVRTSDNVKLSLEGTVFWQISDVRKMINMTSDPEGDVWHRARSTLIQAVSNVTLQQFMGGFNNIVMSAFSGSDDFYTSRGITLQSMELTRYTPVDAHTRTVLQAIIRETTNRINRLQKQISDNEVRNERLQAEIQLEENRTTLIETQARNSKLLAETRGATDGGGIATSIASFIDGLNASMPNATGRMELYRLHETLEATKTDTSHLSSGNASLYVAPKEMELRLQMPHSTAEL